MHRAMPSSPAVWNRQLYVASNLSHSSSSDQHSSQLRADFIKLMCAAACCCAPRWRSAPASTTATSTAAGASAWTSSRTSGALHSLSARCCCPSAPCSQTQTQVSGAQGRSGDEGPNNSSSSSGVTWGTLVLGSASHTAMLSMAAAV
jgi:hypothetical protein